MKPKILIVSKEFYHTVGHRLHRQLPYLSDKFDLHSISLVPYSKGYEKQLKYERSIYKKMIGMFKVLVDIRFRFITIDDNTIEIRGLPLPRSSSFVNAVWWCLMIAAVKKRILAVDYDCVFLNNPYSSLPVMPFLKRNAKILYEVIDKFNEFEKSCIRKKIIGGIEKHFVRRANLVVCVGDSLRDYYSNENNNIEIIYNGVTRPIKSSEGCLKKYDFIFVGSAEKFMGIQCFLDVFKNELEKDHTFLIVGEGTYKNALREKIALENIKNVCFMDKVEYTKIPELLSMSRYGVATYENIPLMKYAFTLKIVEYWNYGLPVIYTNVGETAVIAARNSLGVVLGDKFKDSFDGINKDYLKVSERCKAIAKNYYWDKLMEKEISLILEMKNHSGKRENKEV